MTWTPERRQQASERMKATRPIAAKLAKKAETLPSGRITRNRIPLEDRRLIRQLGDERNALKQQLSLEQGLWEARKSELMRQIKALSNDCIADKFEVRPNQIHQILNGTAGQSL